VVTKAELRKNPSIKIVVATPLKRTSMEPLEPPPVPGFKPVPPTVTFMWTNLCGPEYKSVEVVETDEVLLMDAVVDDCPEKVALSAF
jgi:hypothetical protein